VQKETQKILGDEANGHVSPADFKVSCTCTRVNVLEGHTEAVYVSTRKRCDPSEVADSMRKFGKHTLDLPSAPKELLVVKDDPFRPQPRIDRDLYDGMAVSVGRIRQDQIREHGVKYVLVSHNTRLGAAKGAVLVTEHLVKAGYIPSQ
jgi:aspartate-semialdehyde dehydrogenase